MTSDTYFHLCVVRYVGHDESQMVSVSGSNVEGHEELVGAGLFRTRSVASALVAHNADVMKKAKSSFH